MPRFLVRRARLRDAPRIERLLLEWLDWKPQKGRADAVRLAIKNREITVAEKQSRVVGFIHFVLHRDIIDGEPNAFITAFYVQKRCRGLGIGTSLLQGAIIESAARGATFIETSTNHSRAKAFYEKHGFKQTFGDIGETFLELDVAKFEAQ